LIAVAALGPSSDTAMKISEGITRDCLVFEPDLATLTSLLELKSFGALSHGVLKKRKVELLFRRLNNQDFSVGCNKAVLAIKRGDRVLETVIGRCEHGFQGSLRGA